METIKVNMSPNPLDVQTIHASQNDGEAREWGFALHNNGDAIDSSSISDQLVFKSYKGGTEQILPENGAVPVTAPFVGDIKYQDATRTDQEFLYRQSPTEEDGLAKITDIKGNTLVWNQLVPPLSAMQGQNGTISVADNVATITSSSSTGYLGMATSGSAIELPKSGHKYLLTCEVKSSKAMSSCSMVYGNNISVIKYNLSANTWTKLSNIVSYSSPTGQYVQCRVFGSFEQGDTMQVRNWNYFDLTAMGLDSITSVDEFTSLFSLPYYDYNTGTLLSFNGNGIKTVGFNQWDEEWEDGSITGSGVLQPISSAIRSKNFCPCFPNTTYYLRVIEGMTGQAICWYDSAKNFIIRVTDQGTRNAISPSNASYFKLSLYNYKIQDHVAYNNDVCLNISDTLKNGTYEPYTETTLSLPTLDYFPTGMKSAGTVYDELLPTKAITRIGAVDLGTITYTYDGECFIGKLPSDAKVLSANTETLNSVSDRYLINNWSSVKYLKSNMTLGTGVSRYICIFNNSYTDATAFKTAMSGVYLYYELATPTETSFTTASLVTENAEIPLSNNDGTLIGKCTEEISAEPGFHDAKIKLSDADGECYSNKLQFHVERKPS